MKPVVIQTVSWAPKGSVFVMADTSHPEIDLMTTIDDANKLRLVCHPDEEEAVRDAVAICQERPKWWEDMRRFEALLTKGRGR